MKANKQGFFSEFRTCTGWNGNCEIEGKCQRKATTDDLWAFGSGPNYKINSNEKFHVMYEFWTTTDVAGDYSQLGQLTEIRQTISQGNNEVVIVSDCSGVEELTNLLSTMSLGIANYSVGKYNDANKG